MLIDYRADGRANLDSGLTPLYGACYAGHVDVVIYLATNFPQQLQIPVTVDETYPLHAAVMKGHTEIVRYLLTLRQTESITAPLDSPREKKVMKPARGRRNTSTSSKNVYLCMQMFVYMFTSFF